MSALLDAHLLADILRNSILVYHVVHCLCYDVVLRHVPCALVLTGFAPRVLYHVVLLAVLVLSDTVDEHTVVISESPVVILFLALLLCRSHLRSVDAEFSELIHLLVWAELEPLSHV